MRDENTTCKARGYLIGDLAEGRRVGDHGMCDSSHCLDLCRDTAFRIDQCAPLADANTAVDANDAHFGNSITERRGARCLEIHKGDGGGKHNALATKSLDDRTIVR